MKAMMKTKSAGFAALTAITGGFAGYHLFRNKKQQGDQTVFAQEEKKKKTAKIAIIGAGIGGTSCAYFLHQLAQQSDDANLEVHLFEREHGPGGRTKTLQLTSRGTDETADIDFGGSHIISENKYAMGLVNSFGLHLMDDPRSRLLLWDGVHKKKIWELSGRNWYDMIHLLIRYQFLTPMLRTRAIIRDSMQKFGQIYPLQEVKLQKGGDFKAALSQTYTFENLVDLMKKLDLYDLTQKNAMHYFNVDHKVQQRFLDEMVNPISRINYMQNLRDMTAFAGIVSSAGLVSDFHAIKEGTQEFSNQMLQHALNDTLPHMTVVSRMNTRVNHVEDNETGTQPGVSVTVTMLSGSMKTEKFDYAVLASPIEYARLNLSLPFARAFRKVHVTLVEAGDINYDYFDSEKTSIPALVVTSDPLVCDVESGDEDTDFNQISMKYAFNKNRKIFKIFSINHLKEDQLETWFENRVQTVRKMWNAYPLLEITPPERWHPVKLSPRVFYINAFESLISTMETELIASKNVSLLIAKDIYLKD